MALCVSVWKELEVSGPVMKLIGTKRTTLFVVIKCLSWSLFSPPPKQEGHENTVELIC